MIQLTSRCRFSIWMIGGLSENARLAAALWYAPKGAINQCRDYLMAAIEDESLAAPISGRTLARHFPDLVLERINCFTRKRERELLIAEIEEPEGSLPAPPIESYL